MTPKQRKDLYGKHDKAFGQCALSAIAIFIAGAFLVSAYYELAFIIGGIGFASMGYTMGQENIIGHILGWDNE